MNELLSPNEAYFNLALIFQSCFSYNCLIYSNFNQLTVTKARSVFDHLFTILITSGFLRKTLVIVF